MTFLTIRRPDEALGLSLVRQLERKEKRRAYPSKRECFVERTNLNKDWPV
jgi:hypothetical protein